MEPLTYPDFPRGKSQPERVEILKQATRDAVEECVRDYLELYGKEMPKRDRYDVEARYQDTLIAKWHAERITELEDEQSELKNRLLAQGKKIALLSKRLEDKQ